MFRSLFKKTDKSVRSGPVDESVHAARPGDLLTISGSYLEFEDAYFLVEKRNLYKSGSIEWHEVLGVDGDKRVWVEWPTHTSPTLTVRKDARPIGLDQAGISKDVLLRMDEEESIDNTLIFEGATYHYENSDEALFFDSGLGEGDGFWFWEFTSDQESKVLSVVKWDNVPFEVYVSDILPFDSVNVYNQ
ncbi:DUF4178 domain-containing protein [Dehalococcoidia bacterium]|nr:DUF4178 domain-containing protein [Dehalococcoidia bacterium]